MSSNFHAKYKRSILKVKKIVLKKVVFLQKKNIAFLFVGRVEAGGGEEGIYFFPRRDDV